VDKQCNFEKMRLKEALKLIRKSCDVLTEGKYYVDTILQVGRALESLKKAKTEIKKALEKR